MLYNAERKNRFIESYAKSDSTIRVYTNIFNKVGEVEYKYNTDLCNMDDKEQILEAVSCVSGNRSPGTNWKIKMLQQYVQWCADILGGISNNLINISARDVNIAYMKNHMASDPDDFNSYLDSFLRPDELITIDIIYKCVLWLGYAGFPEEKILELRNFNVDLEIIDRIFTIEYDGKEYFVPDVAVSVFQKCIELKAFSYTNANYTGGSIMRSRVDGDVLLRGVRATSKSFRVLTQNISNRAKECDMKRRINYTNASLSGFFYHLFTIEQHNSIDFKFYADNYVSQREYKLDKSNSTLASIKTKVAKELEFDYKLWKLAFKK